jgi:hypothetical protein
MKQPVPYYYKYTINDFEYAIYFSVWTSFTLLAATVLVVGFKKYRYVASYML